LSEARELNANIRMRGVRVDRADQAARALQWRQMALVSEAVLAALDAYLGEGGGSRGARAVCDPEGSAVPVTRLGPLEPFRFRAERAEDRARKMFVRFDGDGFACDSRPIRRRDRTKAAYFERDWARFLSGAIFETESDVRI
jgi:succinate dehydrogenase / fumarate reductase flavoprotein subunit